MEKPPSVAAESSVLSEGHEVAAASTVADDGGASKTPAETQHLTGLKLYILVVSMTSLVFIMTLNASVVATAIPSITSEFHSIEDIGWYGSAYLLSNCALQPLTGKLYTMYSSRWTFLTFLFIFEIGSLLSGVAVSSEMLIIGRAVTGMGGSGLANGALTIIAASAPIEKRPVLIGIVMGLGTVGQIIGPLIGGALTDNLSWRWCFYLNLPMSAPTAILFLTLRFPDNPKSPPSSLSAIPRTLDLAGFLLFAPAVVMALLALEWGGSTYAWSSATILGLFIGAFFAILLFLFWEHHKGDKAMIPLNLLQKRVVYSACLTGMMQMGALMLLSYFLPTWFQLVRGKSPTMSGVSILPTFVSQITGSLLSGFLVSRIGYYTPFALMGSAITAIGAGLMTTFTPTTPTANWIGFQILSGGGRGLVSQQPLTAVQATTAPALIPITSSLVVFSQYFGGALFISLGNTIFTNRLVPALALYAPGVDPKVVENAGARGVRGAVSAEQLPGVLLGANKALTQVYYLAIGAALCAFMTSWGLGWTSVKGKKKGGIAGKEEEGRKDDGTDNRKEEDDGKDKTEENRGGMDQIKI